MQKSIDLEKLYAAWTVSNPSGPSQTPPVVPEGPKGAALLGLNPYIIGVYGFLLTSGSMHNNPW